MRDDFRAIPATHVMRPVGRLAVVTSVQIVRAFVRLREMAGLHRDLARKLDELEKKYDSQFAAVFDAIRGLMQPRATPRRRIGFGSRDQEKP